MPFAFSQVEPETTGTVLKMPTPVSTYLNASAEQGWHDSAFASIMRMREYSLEAGDDGSKILDPDEASQLYGIPKQLSFDQPVRESVAQLLNARKRAEMDRNFSLQNGGTAATFVPGLAISFLAGIANPLDFGSMFIPFVGSERVAASILGRGTMDVVRRGIARGLFTEEGIAQAFPRLPRFTSSVIQGMAYQSAYEIPNMITAGQENRRYTANNFLENIVLGGAATGALHVGITAAARLFRTLKPQTQDAMLRQAVNDFLQDRESDLSKYVDVDENVIHQRVAAELEARIGDVRKIVDIAELKHFIKEKYAEFPEKAAYKLSDGTTIEGNSHLEAISKIPEDVHAEYMSPEDKQYLQAAGERYVTDEGFITNKGRFVGRQEAGGMLGREPGRELLSEEFITDTSHLSEREQALYYATIEGGGSKQDAINRVRQERQQRAEQLFFSRPEIEELMNRERDARIQQFIAKTKEEFNPEKRFDDLRQEEINRQIAAGKTMPQEQVDRHTVGDDIKRTQQSVEDHIKSLESDLKEPSAPPEQQSAIDKMIDTLNKHIDSLEEKDGKLMIDPFLIQALGKPVLRGALIVAREVLKAGKSVTEAVDWAMAYIKKRQSGTSRRDFLKTLGKIAAATQLPIKLGGESAVTMKVLLHGHQIIGDPGLIDKTLQGMKIAAERGDWPKDWIQARTEAVTDVKHLLWKEYDIIGEFVAGGMYTPEGVEINSKWHGDQVVEFLKDNGVPVGDLTDKQIRRIGYEYNKLLDMGFRNMEHPENLPSDLLHYNALKESDFQKKIATIHVPKSVVDEFMASAQKAKEAEIKQFGSFYGGDPDPNQIMLTPEQLGKIKLLSHEPLGPLMETILSPKSSVLKAVSQLLIQPKVGLNQLSEKVKQVAEKIKKLEPKEEPAARPKEDLRTEDEKIREALAKEIAPEGESGLPPDMDAQGWHTLNELGKNEQLDRMNELKNKIAEIESQIPHPEAIDTALDCILKKIA